MKRTTLANLNPQQQAFLIGLTVEFCGKGDSIPVYVRGANDEFLLVDDAFLYQNGNKKFETEAPTGLYRGGAVAIVKTVHGLLVVADERFNWYKPFAGIAKREEGDDLTLTARRELGEEAFVFSLDKKHRFVPEGFSDLTNKVSLNFHTEYVTEVGKIDVLGYEVNEKNRAFEAVIQWDISELTDFSVSSEEEWWSKGVVGIKGSSGIVVCTIDNHGKLTGYFSGQQGFIPFPEFGVHTTLAKYLNK